MIKYLKQFTPTKARRNIRVLALAAILSSSAGQLWAQKGKDLHTLNLKSPADLHAFFKYTGQDVPLISGHRGGMIKGFPENCIATFENTLRHTPAFFEIDPRLTKDSVIVLMHDATLERTTTGKGKVSDYTWAELQKLKLKDVEGNITEHRIPTLDEVINWSKGKTIINLDKKDVPLAMTAKKLQEHQADTYVMLTVHNAQQAKYYYDQNKNRMFSAFVRTKKEFEDFENSGVPWSQIMAYVGPTNKPENKELYDLLHARGVKCMISAAPTYDKLKDPTERRKAYRETFQAGADVLESDLPIEAAAAIQDLIPKKSPKLKYFQKPGGSQVKR
ncbi:glycerophosphodiester phosphodiesterase family protein [Adhaeribacter rhizoryzae]|uniref:Glycerophosphodiester phosphodiesterase family protein n=1 Tax=Adhaeribacter rhizoryzae TaxID=2607907 RepID=A0A5M6DIU5_9BACT|nr:glycerophosphodiester phosphodiesterase family protein [Adhaeribacter rhizoryzae]KAA5547494.1 glycerophosphodiester phosphodiesterase family protein [Adhaeribacter rhizoryzae]